MRFATSKIGWLFGPALFQTGDGGRTWTRVDSAKVVDVEAARGEAMRITTTDQACGAGCSFQMDRLHVGSSTWTRLPNGPAGAFPVVLLQGTEAYDVNIPNWAGAGRTYLARSDDGGSTWTEINDPCPGPPGAYRTAAASAAPRAVFTVLCESVDDASGSVRVSTDGGKTFGPRHALPAIPLITFGPIAAASAGTIAIPYSNDQKYGVVVTHDGGITWRTTLAPSAPPSRATGFVPSLGWEDARTARASFNTDTIWTTRDAGRSWTPSRVTP